MTAPLLKLESRYERRTINDIGRLVLSLTPDQMRQYDRWQRLCRKNGIPITPQERRDYLVDLKEMPQ